MKRGASLRARLLVGVLVAMAACWALTALVGYAAARHELDELLDAHLAQTTAMIVEQIAEDSDEDEVEHAPQWHRYSTQIAFQVWEHGRRLGLHSKSAPRTRLSDVAEGFSTSDVQGRQWRVFSAWTHEHDTLVQVGELVSARRAVAGEIVGHMLTPLAIALPVLALLLAVAIGRGLKPLNELATEVADLAPDRLDPIGVEGVPGEVRPLVGQLNGLFARIGALIAGERRFTADAAHELRTPIAAIRAQAQVALGAAAEDERREACANVVQGCDRASHLIDQLLTLARLDAASTQVMSAHCRLEDVAQQTIALLAQTAHTKGIAIELDAAESGAPVACDPALLGVLVRNLLDNAIRYSPAGTMVTVDVSHADGAVLEIRDEGSGIPTTERERVTERFYRVLGSGQSGSGLGLSIVSRIAALCGAKLVLEAGSGGRGLVARVSFPPVTTK
jgi:two-component system sensor histidine kinase QseC